MIRFSFRQSDLGDDLEFLDAAKAQVFAQDEASRWEVEIKRAGGTVSEDPDQQFSGYLAPWLAWISAIQEVRAIRNLERGDFDVEVGQQGLAKIDSRSGRALLWTLKVLGEKAAHYAAISDRLAVGSLDWNDDAGFKGVIAYERFIRNMREADEREAKKPLGHGMSDLSDKLEKLRGDIETLIADGSERIDHEFNAASVQRAEHARIFEELRDQTASLAASAEREIGETISQLNYVKGEASKAALEATSQLKIDLKTEIGAAETRISEYVQKGQSDIENFAKAHVEDKQLARPARLWAHRAKIHKLKANNLKNIALLTGSIGFCITVCVGWIAFDLSGTLLETAMIPGPIALKPGTIKPTFHYQMALTGLITLAFLTMYLWTMRMLVRLYTTEHHLFIDASARGAMNDTYIGLIAAGGAVIEDRSIVLTALFKPVQDGIVSDDGLPLITPAALMSNLASGAGKS